jgi:hypothetical protein
MRSRPLFFILIAAFFLRIFGIMWDANYHLHPDERMLIMVADRIHFFNQLNPDFFNYGSLPVYILKGISQSIDAVFHTNMANYSGMLFIGRFISLFFDLGVIILIYRLAMALFQRTSIAVWSAFLYAIAFFPIQNTHFFIVDVFLTFFLTLLIYQLVLFIKKPSLLKVLIIAVVYATALATKVTPVLFYPIIVLVLITAPLVEKAGLKKGYKQMLAGLVIFHLALVASHFCFMPYAYFSYAQFFKDIQLQLLMNNNPYIFPYTLQYVGTTPYLYYLKNIFLWGLGPFISFFTVLGIFFFGQKAVSHEVMRIDGYLTRVEGETTVQRFSRFFIHHIFKTVKGIIKHRQVCLLLVVFVFYGFYFAVIGKSAVKFMRYMLPLYPFLTILAGFGLHHYFASKPMNKVKKISAYIFIFFALMCTFAFVSIYSKVHTRIAATDWILKNIPSGSTLATEHWDDRVPIYGDADYKYVEMSLYDRPDDEIKWDKLSERLNQADYIIIASNRLYVPLQRLVDCQKYQSCYPITAEYYKKLFHDKLNFTKVADFTAYPTLSIGPWKLEIPDDTADESFTVYDHPRILIFQKTDHARVYHYPDLQ